MDDLEIRLIPVTFEGDVFWSYDILVNGRSFLDQVRAFEQPFADAEGHPGIAGSYAHVPAWPRVLGFFADELVGKHGVGVALFECDCGTPGCWPLMADIVVEPERVLWQRFRQPHRRGHDGQAMWDYSGFGPFTFDRRAYEGEVQKLRDLAAQLPEEEVSDDLEEEDAGRGP